MAVESLVALGLATVFLVGIAWYASKHREEDKGKGQSKHHHA